MAQGYRPQLDGKQRATATCIFASGRAASEGRENLQKEQETSHSREAGSGRLRFGAKPIPPRSVVIDSYWRRNDPLPALVHYPYEVVLMAAAHTSAWCGRLRQKIK